MYNIFVDGIEGSGKTTLCNKLLNQYPNLNYIKFIDKVFIDKNIDKEDIQQCIFFEMSKTVKDLIPKQSYLFDRAFISHFVYNKKLDDIAKEELMYYFSKLDNSNILVYLQLPLEVVEQNLKNRNKDNPLNDLMIKDLASNQELFDIYIERYKNYFDQVIILNSLDQLNEFTLKL